MCDELPPPVTKSSSKADLWAEIEAMEREIESQQSRINALTAELEQERAARLAENRNCAYLLRMRAIIREAVAGS
jgi:hypothetical protein